MCAFVHSSVRVCLFVRWEILERNKLARLLEPNTSLCYHGYHVDVIIIIVSKYIYIILLLLIIIFCLAAFVLLGLFLFWRNVQNVFVFCTIATLVFRLASDWKDRQRQTERSLQFTRVKVYRFDSLNKQGSVDCSSLCRSVGSRAVADRSSVNSPQKNWWDKPHDLDFLRVFLLVTLWCTLYFQ